MSRMLNQNDPAETKRLMIALLIIGLGLISWQVVFEAPRQHAAQIKRQQEEQVQQNRQQAMQMVLDEQIVVDRKISEEMVNSQATISIESDQMQGAIALQGGRLNYLKLLDYAQTTEDDSPVILLQPQGVQAYFIEFGWLADAANNAIKLPSSKTVWQTDKDVLTVGSSVTLSWDNGEGLRFENVITLEGAYLFRMQQRVINKSNTNLQIMPYGYINRTFEGQTSELLILHEGPIGVLDGTLSEFSYDELIEEKTMRFADAKGWVGLSDKYWLSAIIPHNGESFTANYKGYITNKGFHRYQTDFLGKPREIAVGETGSYESLIFAGAKKLEMLDNYSEEYNIPLLDRAVDLGFLYFLTKPLLYILTALFAFAGDFGLAIILLTFLVKLAMYPLANKSYISMNEMKRLGPRLKELKERYGDDRMRFQQEMMKMYKKEKINPASGCLPLLVQIPVFFALYKVLLVTIEMRHANFYSILEDLSAPDPSNIFTLFGLIDWNPPSMLHIGIMVLIMSFTMFLQQQLNPKPTDPVQAKVMKFLPLIFIVVLAGFPAGLLLYWICSNTLSILQQWSIKKRYNRKVKRREDSAANDA